MNASYGEQTAHNVVLLTRQGMSRRAIARALKLSRNTVRKILASHGKARVKEHSALERKPTQKRRSKLDPHRARIDELLKEFPDITAQRVFEELKVAGFLGGYTGVKGLVRAVRPKPAVKPSMETTVYDAGEMAENDWSPYRIKFTHAPERTLQCFSYALVHSHRKRYSIHERTDLHALMDGHVKAFTALDGLAKQCKYDNQKPVVLRWEGKCHHRWRSGPFPPGSPGTTGPPGDPKTVFRLNRHRRSRVGSIRSSVTAVGGLTLPGGGRWA